MELMADSGKATIDYFGKHIVFINVMRRMSVDCDCAGTRAAALPLESEAKRAAIRLPVFAAALSWLQGGNTPHTPRLLGADFDETGVREGMERCYRALAHETIDMWERIALVEKANAVRPRTRT